MFRNFIDKVFGHKNSEEIQMEKELRAITAENLVKEFKIKNTIEENGMSEEIKQEEILVQDAPEVEEVSEETEVVQDEQTEQPKNEGKEIEPSEPKTVGTPEEEVVEEEPKEQEEPEQEEKEEEIVEEQKPEQEQVEVIEEPCEEIPAEVKNEKVELVQSIETPVDEVPVKSTSEVSEREAQLLKEVEALKAEKAEKEIQMQKMELSKEVEQDFNGVPGKVEDKVNTIFEIKNSALSEETKTFILTSLKSLSAQNLADCEEIGHDQEVEVDEKADRQNKIKTAMDKYNLTENQAFLFVNGDRSLAEAQKASARVQSKRK